jgi:hypothetical protein
MAWKKESAATFTGGSDQVAVMAELLHRKCNAAVPHVDVGTDVFAFRDDREHVARIQVKTAPAKLYKDGSGYSAKFGVTMAQLSRPDSPPLFYAFAVRMGDAWGAFVVISRTNLKELWDEGCGSENPKSGDLELQIQFRPKQSPHDDEAHNSARARCGEFDLSEYLNAWEILPPLKPREHIPPERPQAATRSPGGT